MRIASTNLDLLPEKDCRLCPRLAAFRDENRLKFPDQWNAPVPSFGSIDAQLLIVGLAPGLKGANFTGRPFTKDYAGDLLYQTLLDKGFASGTYEKHRNDGLALINCRITNSVRCVPPENKPTTSEMHTCRGFFETEIARMKQLKVMVSLGLIAHKTIIKTFGLKQSAYKFVHNTTHDLGNGIKLVNSYHCSRYNTSTKRLTKPMFYNVFDTVQGLL